MVYTQVRPEWRVIAESRFTITNVKRQRIAAQSRNDGMKRKKTEKAQPVSTEKDDDYFINVRLVDA
ncbi:MAG: hypothetical protein LBR34_06795 [Prevotella sp.]|jgi:hypothetical protein|nr:hypothetical protein [Prevotella sp.]